MNILYVYTCNIFVHIHYLCIWNSLTVNIFQLTAPTRISRVAISPSTWNRMVNVIRIPTQKSWKCVCKTCNMRWNGCLWLSMFVKCHWSRECAASNLHPILWCIHGLRMRLQSLKVGAMVQFHKWHLTMLLVQSQSLQKSSTVDLKKGLPSTDRQRSKLKLRQITGSPEYPKGNLLLRTLERVYVSFGELCYKTSCLQNKRDFLHFNDLWKVQSIVSLYFIVINSV